MQNNNRKLVNEHRLENSLSTFIFSILGIVFPVYLFSVIALTYSKKKQDEKLKKLVKVGEKLGYAGLILSSVLIIGLAIYNIIRKFA